MALNINTNITNNLDGYLLDAKNVKGGYIVVADYSELVNLPSATVIEGTLAYCQYATVYEATDYQDGFYIYKNSSWTVYPMGIGKVVFDKYNQTNFDITQTYSWAYNDSDVSNNFTAITTMASNGGLLQINFDGDAFLFNYSGISQTNKSSVSMVVIYDNKQYIATVVVDGTDLSNIFVLSFQEIEGGSGGGGTTTTKKWYKFSLKTNVSDGQGGTRNDAENELISYIDEEQLQELITNVNTAMGTSYSTKEDLIALYNTLKSDDLSNSLQTYLLLCGLFTWLCNYSQYTNAKPTYRLQMDNGEEQRMNVVTTIFNGGAGSIFVATGYNSIDIPFVDNFNDTAMTGDVSKMAFDSNSTLTIIEETETIGGGTGTGGSGKLYELSMELTRYDENGSAVTWTGDGAISTSTLPLTIHIYESNFEKIKEKFNDFIDLYNQTFGQSLGITLPYITDINSLVSFINTFVVETVADGDTLSYYLIQTLVNLSDKAYFEYTYTDAPFYFNLNASTFSLDYVFGAGNGQLLLAFDYNDADRYYALNAHNSCTLTEYGTSGSGGGSGSTKKWYVWRVNDTFAQTSVDGNNVSSSAMIIKLDEEKQNEMISWLDALAKQLDPTASISTIQDIIDAYDMFKVDNQYLSVLQLIMLQELPNKAMQIQSQCELHLGLGQYGEDGDGWVLYPSALSQAFGGVTGTSLSNEFVEWRDYTLGSNSTLTITETTETTGGSSSSQSTVPERFSMAYNLVVNINQEQFANGSWTGSNSDNIRTFQYNGSNADQAKATELVEFLTGVPVLDEYNATKPTPCFVFCTQSNICWKLQWDNSLLYAYKVENFPFVVKENNYRWTISNINDNELRFWLSETAMQDLYSAINQVMPNIDPTWQDITDYGGVISFFNTLKQNASDPTTFGLILAMLGCGGYVFGDRNIYSQKTPIYFTKFSSNGIETVEVTGIKALTSGGVLTILYKDPFGILSNGLITNDSSEASDGIYIDSNATLQITKI